MLIAEDWFGVKGFELAGAAGLEEIDDSFRLRREMRYSAAKRSGVRCGNAKRCKYEREGERAETKCARAQEVAPGAVHEVVVVWWWGLHGCSRSLTSLNPSRGDLLP